MAKRDSAPRGASGLTPSFWTDPVIRFAGIAVLLLIPLTSSCTRRTDPRRLAVTNVTVIDIDIDAVSGCPPMAQTSDSAFAAATCP